jgi:hypothetical protein
MNSRMRTAKPDLVLGALAGALLLLPLPTLLTVGAEDVARLGLLALLVVPPVIFMAIAHRRLGNREMRTEAVRIRR